MLKHKIASESNQMIYPNGLKFVPQNPPKIGNQSVKILERSEIRGGPPFHCRLNLFDCAVRKAENGFYFLFFEKNEGIDEFVGI